MSSTAEKISGMLLPEPASCLLRDGREYNPAHCMAVYIPPAEYEEDSLRLPAMIAGEAVSHHGQACTLLAGIPKSPPGGSIVMGTWSDLEQLQPRLLDGLPQPAGESDYLIQVDGFVLLTAGTREGVLHGAHTLGQLLSTHINQIIPALLISDQALYPERSLVYDLTRANVTIDHLVNLIALISSFKANRLHLVMQPETPLSNDGSLGAVAYDDALAIGRTCREYGIVPVPSADLTGLVGTGRCRTGQACEAAMDLLNAFDTDAIAIGGMSCPATGDRRAVRGFIRSLLDNCEYELEIYLDACAVRLLYADTPVPGQVVAQFTPASATEAALEFMSSASVAISMHATSMARSFIPPAPHAVHAQIEHALRLAGSSNAVEFGFFADNIRCGHLLANDLPEAVTCLCCAWKEYSSPSAAATAFAEFAFADKAGDFITLRERLARNFPAALRSPEADPVLHSAFGFPLRASAWQQIAALDRRLMREKTGESELCLRAFKNRIQGNLSLIEYADIGLAAMRFLDSRQKLLLQARCHYQAARLGRSGSLRMAHAAISDLLEQHRVFLDRIREVFAATGTCRQELESLTGLGRTLTDLRERLRELESTDKTGILPEPAEFGFPDDFPAIGDLADHD